MPNDNPENLCRFSQKPRQIAGSGFLLIKDSRKDNTKHVRNKLTTEKCKSHKSRNEHGHSKRTGKCKGGTRPVCSTFVINSAINDKFNNYSLLLQFLAQITNSLTFSQQRNEG